MTTPKPAAKSLHKADYEHLVAEIAKAVAVANGHPDVAAYVSLVQAAFMHEGVPTKEAPSAEDA